MKTKIAPKNVSKFKIIIPIFIFLLPAISWAADLSIPDARRVDWQGNVGVPGGIPTVTAICATTECNTLYGGNVTVSTITAAVASAANSAPPYNPSRITVVRIPAGTFDLGSGQIQINRGNVILRGAGKNQTTLQSSNPGYFILTNGSGADYGPQGAISSGYTKGSTSVTLDDASAISAGDFMYLTQDSESFMYSDWSGIQLFKQLLYITNVSGNTVSFSPPLAHGLSSNLHPKFQHYYGIKQGLPIIGYIGIEDLKIDLASATSGSAAAIWYNIVYAPWVKNVEIANFGDLAILASYSVHGTVTESNFISPQPGREGHGVYLYANTTGWLVENNYSSGVWSTVLGLNPVYSVIAYNYAYDTYSYYTQEGTWQVQSYITQHGPHEMMDLWEGNVGEQFQNDGYHGSGSHQTIFRNYIHGVSPRGITINRKMMDLDRFSYWHNVVGNVLGDPSWTPYAYQMSGTSCSYTSCPTIYRLGYPHMGNNWYDEGIPPQGNGMEPNRVSGEGAAGLDPEVQATLVRHMNFDYYNKAARTCDQESEGCQGVTGTTLPASLYLSAKPSWWCNESPWPPFGPDVAGYHGKIPAQIAFEGGICTHGNGDTTPPAAPSGLTVN